LGGSLRKLLFNFNNCKFIEIQIVIVNQTRTKPEVAVNAAPSRKQPFKLYWPLVATVTSRMQETLWSPLQKR